MLILSALYLLWSSSRLMHAKHDRKRRSNTCSWIVMFGAHTNILPLDELYYFRHNVFIYTTPCMNWNGFVWAEYRSNVCHYDLDTEFGAITSSGYAVEGMRGRVRKKNGKLDSLILQLCFKNHVSLLIFKKINLVPQLLFLF